MTNFEGTEFSLDNDPDDESLDEIQRLLLDIPSLLFIVFNNENSKAFFILLGFMEKAEEMITNLANRSFSLFLINIGNVSFNHINSTNATCDKIETNPIPTNWYLFDKFYEIMIDTNISKHFTVGYGQYMAYKKDIKYTTIDISKIGAIYVKFDIDSILSIRFILI